MGWRYLYHLGDEAMTEAAVAELRRRDVEPVLVAGSPAVAREMYGVSSVARFGFRSKWRMAEHEELLSKVERDLDRGEVSESPLLEALRKCDIAIIAGGGNLASQFPSHVFERYAFALAATKFGKPLVVLSQTIGPTIEGRVGELVQSVLHMAKVVGCRESISHGLALGLDLDSRKIVRSFDDAILLNADGADRDEAAMYAPSGRPFVIGSFPGRNGSLPWSKEEHVARVSSLLDKFALSHGCDVLLVPHMASLPAGYDKADQISHAAIVGASQSGLVRALPGVRAKTLVALMEMSRVSISSRYHPAVFALPSASPVVGVPTSRYSLVKLQGALENAGMSALALPTVAWNLLLPALGEAWDRSSEFASHLLLIRKAASAYQCRLWDGVADLALGGTFIAPSGFPLADQIPMAGAWSVEAKGAMTVFEQWLQSSADAKLS
ncbi:polysaccharide pyruvyl transferase family protein [Ornithinicoccus hortensis]|uniref:polysaccharide pyruvyl transferase family protein n=1 Tax=Ornithinicoccus hortensis TaxID=82346 RepID=UPI00225E0CBE|nr:polysaccharide pyruvyl transferase family protein [Ornithinicoccus hortensis]